MRIRTLLFSVFLLSLLGPPWLQGYRHAQAAPARTDVVTGGMSDSTTIYLPLVATARIVTPAATFTAIPVQGAPIDRTPATHPDLNLALRSYTPITATLTLIEVDGPADTDAPQLAGLFNPPRLPGFTAAYQVHDWDWRCGADGCRGNPLSTPPVTVLAMTVTPGEPLFIPTRSPQIYAGGYKALVLYAEETRITLTYTREDTPAHGYIVHLEEIQVDPALLALYREKDAAGRQELPALHSNERFANAGGDTLKVVIRDTGSFMDPRTRKNWWKGF